MAEAVLEIVFENLNSLIQNELGLFLGFDQDLEKLASSFTAIKATLEDAEEKQFTDRAIKDWLRKLKDAAYILDDILDECAYQALGSEYQGIKCGLPDKVRRPCLSSFHPKHVVFRYKTAKKMKRIRERLDEIAQERSKYHLTVRDPQRRSGVIDWRQTISFISEPQIYGRKDDVKKIVDFLIGDASHFEELCVYPIVGLGGLGKTTLAQVIFNHERVVNHFELRVWVCVSEDFSWKRMTKVIIKEASGNSCEDLDLEQLQQRLRHVLQSKRYLLVLDDVWDDDQENWQMLKSLLACGAKGSSVLVTTRLLTVATIMKTTPPHELSKLSDHDCWQLFKCRAFGPDEAEQEELVVIGKEMVKKCRGVPLAAKALGGLLRFKRRKSEWLNIMESNLLEVSHDENSIMPVLRLSYLNLPTKLRQCFAFCAIFPKDETIKKEYLIELWMANGFISSIERLDSEDVGDDVWNELYWRSFFQDVERDGFGNVTLFKLHDLVHDLAQFIAEDLCCIIDDNGVGTLSKRIYHLSDHTHESGNMNLIQLHLDKPLRTCILLHYNSCRISKCYSLRVLHYVQRKELSPKIGHMKHLRYLNLSYGMFKTLPESLCKLWNLHILILNTCRSLQKLPNSLIRLKALRKLSLMECFSLKSLPPHIGKLTSLRILSKFIVGKERGFNLAELGQLKLKGYLEIEHLEKVKSVMDAREANMSSKQLNQLLLSWDKDKEWELQENVEEILQVLKPDTQQLERLDVKGYKGSHFPEWMSSCPSLKTLYIENCNTFNVSAGFQCLEELVIWGCREVEGLNDALPHMTALQNLCLANIENLESLPDCFGNLQLLRLLSITDCSKLKCLPSSLSLSTLELFRIIGCCDELKKRCEKETGDDWPKIAHIPQIELISYDDDE